MMKSSRGLATSFIRAIFTPKNGFLFLWKITFFINIL